MNLFLVCREYEEAIYGRLFTGYIRIEWDAPDDPQIKYYRVYRREAIPEKHDGLAEADVETPTGSNKAIPETAGVPVDEPLAGAGLDWTMVGDRVAAPRFTDPVAQGSARDYYYMVTAVSALGVESIDRATLGCRVPATMPPEAPATRQPVSNSAEEAGATGTEPPEITPIATYNIAGSEPIGIEIDARNASFAPASGFSVDKASRAVNAASSLGAGAYIVTAAARSAPNDIPPFMRQAMTAASQ